MGPEIAGPNGQQQKRLPTIHVGWDADAQQVTLQFVPDEFKQWEFLIAVLEMAKMKAEMAYKAFQMQQIQAAQQAAMQEEAVRRSLRQ